MIGKIKKEIINHLPILILIIFGLITHIAWLSPSSILTHGDWQFRWDEHVKELYYAWNTWIGFHGLGGGNVTLFSYPFRGVLWSGLVNLGMTYDMAVRLSLMYPIAILGFVAPYLYIKTIIKDRLISFVCALFYGTTTYFLMTQTAHLPIAFVYSIAPLLILIFSKALQKNQTHTWLLFTMLFSVGIYYEVRIMYIVSIILLLYFIIFHVKKIKQYIKPLLLVGCLTFLLNLFWIFPTIFGLSVGVSEITGRGLFGNHLTNILHALTVSHWSWTGGLPDKNFNIQPISWYLWLIPLFAFSSLLFKNINIKKYLIFFLSISLLGIFTTKQAGEPFHYTYSFLYENFPGFSLFRESSKFLLLTSFGFTGLLSLALVSVKKRFITSKNYLFYIPLIIIIIISLLNVKPLVTGEFGTLFQERTIPNDYKITKNLLQKENNYFRTLWVPTDSKWALYTTNHPVISGVKTLNNSQFSLLEQENKNMKEYVSGGRLLNQALNHSIMNQLQDILSIKYVFVPLVDNNNDNNFYVYFGGHDKQFYIYTLDNLDYLEKVDIGTERIVVYENSNFRPHIYITSEEETITEDVPYREVLYNTINPTRHEVVLQNIDRPLYLNFSESYHPNWNVRVGDFDWKETIYRDDYFISNEHHIENDAGLNSFYIAPEAVCSQYQCIENDDGTYDMKITLFFKPQAYLYAGGIVSLTTLAGVLGYLGYVGAVSVRNKYKSTKNQELGTKNELYEH